MKSLSVKIVLAFVLLIGFAYGNAYAQGVNFSIWDGSYWSTKFTAKGVLFSDPATPPNKKINETEKSWAIMISSADGSEMTLQFYQKNDRGECVKGDEIPITLMYGGPLGFVATITIDEPEPDFNSARVLLYFTGKLKGEALTSGKIATLGGYAIEQDWDDVTDRAAFGVTLSGTLLKEPKGCLLDK